MNREVKKAARLLKAMAHGESDPEPAASMTPFMQMIADAIKLTRRPGEPDSEFRNRIHEKVRVWSRTRERKRVTQKMKGTR